MGEKLNSMKINEKDSVAVAFTQINAGDCLDASFDIKVKENIPMAHKIAVKQIEKGEEVLKYGQPIGIATETIPPGSWVHTHNLIPSEETDFFEYNPKLEDFSPKQTDKLFLMDITVMTVRQVFETMFFVPMDRQKKWLKWQPPSMARMKILMVFCR